MLEHMRVLGQEVGGGAVATSVEDLQTIHKLRGRDHDTFEVMVHAYGPELFRHARRRTLNDAAAEDIVQETFTRAYRALPRLRDDSNVSMFCSNEERRRCDHLCNVDVTACSNEYARCRLI